MFRLTTMLDDYCAYLCDKCKSMKLIHASNVVPDSDSGAINVLPIIASVSC